MGMKFLNKKGWHTGSLRNIENVWKAEQKDEAEKRKLEELRKQIHEERERDDFRQLQEKAGFTPRQERLEFLYDSGLSVGKSSNEGFSALQSYPPAAQTSSATPSSAGPSELNSGAPGALFEEKPQSANDSWRKLHSDPLLMIRQREQEAYARIKNNPVKMAMILKAEREKMKSKKKDDEAHDGKSKKAKSKHKSRSSKRQSDSESDSDEDIERKRKSKHKGKQHLDSDEDNREGKRHHRHSHIDNGNEKQRHDSPQNRRSDDRELLDIGEDLRDRTKYHRHSRRDHGSEKGQGSPVQQKSSRNDGRERLPIDEDSRDRTKDDRQSRRDYRSDRNVDHGSENGQGSPVQHKSSRNVGRERLRVDEGSRDRTIDDRHSRRDYGSDRNVDHGSEKGQGSPVQQKSSRNDGRERLRIDEDSRDGTKEVGHSRRDYGSDRNVDRDQSRKANEKVEHEKYPSDSRDNKSASKAIATTTSDSKQTGLPPKHESFRRRGRAPQLSEEERAARLREMQTDAELHEEQRWKRLKKADEEDALEASKAGTSRGKSFLDDAHKSVYGAEKGGSSTIEESVRRRSHFSQGRTQVDEQNAFRR